MPTVLLLDVSLSMFRPIPSSDATETNTRFTLGSTAINTFLDYLNVHAKLEYVSLVTFSSTYDVAVPFTRDFDTIKAKLSQISEGDKTCFDTAFVGVNQLVQTEWGYSTPMQIIMITDGSSCMGPIGRNRIIKSLPLPPIYPARLHVLPIVSPHESNLQQAMLLYQKMVDLASGITNSSTNINRGAIYCPDQLSIPGVIAAATRLSEQQYQEMWCTLRCGQLECRVQLFPATPQPQTAIHVIGFLSQTDLGTPIAVSRHLVIPQAQNGANSHPRENFDPKTPTKEGTSADVTLPEEDMSDPSKIPNFCVLLHGALKVESMSALVQLSPNNWGCISAWCEPSRSRRSCLLLSVLQPGLNAAPWLGPLDQLGVDERTTNENTGETFPIRATRSYSSGAALVGSGWARPHALLADVQKVLRHARKLPDKVQHLYKELNRLRRAAASLGFGSLLAGVAAALEREAGPGGEVLASVLAALRDPRIDLSVPLQPRH